MVLLLPDAVIAVATVVVVVVVAAAAAAPCVHWQSTLGGHTSMNICAIGLIGVSVCSSRQAASIELPSSKIQAAQQKLHSPQN